MKNENLNSEAMSWLLTHDRTEAEERLVIEIILFLRRIHFAGEVHFRCFLANPKGQVRRPDMYFPRYGLAIEVDGRTRDGWHIRQADIGPRDTFYGSIRARPPLVIPANWVVSSYKMERFKRELQQFLHEDRLTPRQRNVINKRISEGRKKIAEKYPDLFNSHGTLAPKFLYELGDIKEYRHFGGTKVILRTKYQKRPNFDFSTEAYLKTAVPEMLKRLQERWPEKGKIK